MAYTARTLITNAYYLTGIVARSLQTVSGEQITDGFDLLNELLAVKAVDSRLISYFKEYNFNAVPGQEMYFVPYLIAIESMTFNIGPVRYSMLPMARKRYFGSGRADNISSLPFNYHMEKKDGGANVYLYFLPHDAYPMKIWGKFGLTQVPTLDTDLSTVYDKFYLVYLKYALAEYICNNWNIMLQPQTAEKLKELEYIIIDVSPKDLTLSKFSTLQVDTGINYADVNIGRGWRP